MTPTIDAAQVERPRQAGRPLDNADALAARLTPRERAERALLLRADGWSWPRVARHLGYKTRGSARAAALRLALAICPPTQAQRDAARVEALARLDQLWPVVEQLLATALSGDDPDERAAAIQRTQRVIDSYALYLGVPANQTPPAERLARYGLTLAPAPAPAPAAHEVRR